MPAVAGVLLAKITIILKTGAVGVKFFALLPFSCELFTGSKVYPPALQGA